MAILTHGGDSDILYANDRQYKLDELWSKFTADRCPTLAGKPKLFLIQVSKQNLINSSKLIRCNAWRFPRKFQNLLEHTGPSSILL